MIGVDLFSTDTPESNLCRRRESFAQRIGEDAPPLIIALNFCLPWGNFALYWAAPEDRNDVLQQFLDSDDDAYRDARLKLIPRVVEGNWLVRRAVGPGSKAAKLAETIELKYARGAGYVEVSADLCGSATARRILSVVRSGTSGLVLDLPRRRGHDGGGAAGACFPGAAPHRVDPTGGAAFRVSNVYHRVDGAHDASGAKKTGFSSISPRDRLMAASYGNRSTAVSGSPSTYNLPIVRLAEKPYPASIYTFPKLATLPRLLRRHNHYAGSRADRAGSHDWRTNRPFTPHSVTKE